MTTPAEPASTTVTPVTPIGSGIAPTAYTAADHEIDDRTRRRITESVPENTRRSYGRVPLPATGETLTMYVSHLIDTGQRPSTISNRVGAIRTMHRLAGHRGHPVSDGALQLLRGFKRERAAAGLAEDEARPFTRNDLLAMVTGLDTTTFAGLRDRLILTLGFATMARRSELVGLHLGDITVEPEGLVVEIRTSKADKESAGRTVPVPPASLPAICPVAAHLAYREKLAAVVTDPAALGPRTPLLRSATKHGTPRANRLPDRRIWDIVAAAVVRAGLPDPDEYSPHSLRAGGLTAALRAGVPVGIAARHGGWSPSSPVVMHYARVADRWRDNAMRGVM